MLDPVIAFFRRIFAALGRGASVVIAWLFWPFRAANGWYGNRQAFIRIPIAAALVFLVGLYGYFIWQTQVWTNFNPDYVNNYKFSERTLAAGQELPVAPVSSPPASASTTETAATAATPAPVVVQARSCQSSAIVDVSADLIDYNVDQNAWARLKR